MTMDVIVKVPIHRRSEERGELARAVSEVQGVETVNKQEDAVRLQGSSEAFDELKDQFRAQEREEREYDQYEYAKANRRAKRKLSSALSEREAERSDAQ